MNPYQRLQSVPEMASADSIGPLGDPTLDPMNLMARSFREEVMKERTRARAIENQAQQMRKDITGRIQAYENKIRELSEIAARNENAARDGGSKASAFQAEITGLQKMVHALREELEKARQSVNTLQGERDTARTQFRQYHAGHTQAQKDLAELRGKNESLARQIQEARELQQNALRAISTDLQDLRRGATPGDVKEVLERQIIPAFVRMQNELQQTTRKVSTDAASLADQIGSRLDALDRIQTQLSDHDRGVRKDVQRLKQLIQEAMARLSFLDTGSADFSKLNAQVIRIEKNLQANERTMAQISYLMQAIGKQQEQANDLFLNHTEVFLKKQMESFRGLVAEAIARSQRETQRYIRHCFKDMADGNYEFDDLEGVPLTPEQAGDQAASEGARTIVPPPFTHVSPAAEALILAGPPPGTTPQAPITEGPAERLKHLQSLIDKKDDEIRRTEEKLSSSAPTSDAYQKLSLVKDLLRTQREHIRGLAEKLARPDAEPTRGPDGPTIQG